MMNWRDLLRIDLGSLLRGDRPPRVGRRRAQLDRHATEWRSILRMDVGSLLRGDKPSRAERRRRRKYTHPERPELVFRIRKRSWRGPRYLRKARRHNDLVQVTSQLASIVSCNAPIIEGLESAALDAPTGKLEDVFMALREDIAEGSAIAEAMSNRPRFFPRYYVDLVKAGEETGTLYDSLDTLGRTIIRTSTFRDHIQGWLLYLGVIVTAQCLVTSFLLVKVVPTFAAVFADFGATLPPATQALIKIHQWLTPNWPIVFACVGLVLMVWRLLVYFQRKRGLFDRAVGSLFMYGFVIRRIIAKQNLGHIAAVLGPLLAGGVPLDTALEDATSLDINPIYASLFGRLNEQVRNGQTLRESLEAEPWLVPASFRTMVSVGESSGLLPEAFGRIAGLYGRDILKMNKIMADTVGPLVVFVLAGLTLFVTSAIYVTLWQIIDAVNPYM